MQQPQACLKICHQRRSHTSTNFRPSSTLQKRCVGRYRHRSSLQSNLFVCHKSQTGKIFQCIEIELFVPKGISVHTGARAYVRSVRRDHTQVQDCESTLASGASQARQRSSSTSTSSSCPHWTYTWTRFALLCKLIQKYYALDGTTRRWPIYGPLERATCRWMQMDPLIID